MKRACCVAVLLSLLSGAGGCAERDTPSADPTVHASLAAPAMCPWREPEKDMARFFPGATDYSRDTLILSPLRLEIMKRLGKNTPLESNTLYAYRIDRQGKVCGTILVRRASGEFGAIEVVLAISPERRITGLRLQRHREPVPIAAALESPKWIHAFVGKCANDDFAIGSGLPLVPPDAKKSADAVAQAVRSLLIEHDVAETHRNP